MTLYGGLALTVSGLTGIGVAIIRYPLWVMRELLPPQVYQSVVKVMPRRPPGETCVGEEGHQLLAAPRMGDEEEGHQLLAAPSRMGDEEG